MYNIATLGTKDGRWKMEDGRWKMEDGRREQMGGLNVLSGPISGGMIGCQHSMH